MICAFFILQISSTDRMCHNCYRAVGCNVARMQTEIEAEPDQQPRETVNQVVTSHSMSSQDNVNQVLTSQSSSQRSSGSEWLPANVPNIIQETVTSIILPNYKRAVGSAGIYLCNTSVPQ